MTIKVTQAITTREAIKLLVKQGTLTGLDGVKRTLGVTGYNDECDVRGGVVFTTPQALKAAALGQSVNLIDTAVRVLAYNVYEWFDVTESSVGEGWRTVGTYFVDTSGDTPIVYRIAIKYDRRIFRAARKRA